MRHRAPRRLPSIDLSRLWHAGRRHTGWMIENRRMRLALAMASVLVLACAALVTATGLPGDDSVTTTDAPLPTSRQSGGDEASRSGDRVSLPTDGSAGGEDRDARRTLPTLPILPSQPERTAPPAAAASPSASTTDAETPRLPDPSVPAPDVPTPSVPSPDPGGLNVSGVPRLPIPSATVPTGAPSDSATSEAPSAEPTEEWTGDGEDGEDESEEPTWAPTEESPEETPEEPSDVTAPETEIVSSPLVSSSAQEDSEFVFEADEAATFTCSLDGQGFVPCGSTTEFGYLGSGWHTLAVRAIDSAGNVDPTPAQQGWLAADADQLSQYDDGTPPYDDLLR
jgi:hypothetical protein